MTDGLSPEADGVPIDTDIRIRFADLAPTFKLVLAARQVAPAA